MKTKTNKEIIAELQTRGRFKSPEEVDIYFREALEAKDEKARQEKIELIKNIPTDTLSKDYSNLGWDRERVEYFDSGRRDKNLEIIKWQLTQLKNES